MTEQDRIETDETPRSTGLLSEDWLATVVGLAILVLTILGVIPKAVLW